MRIIRSIGLLALLLSVAAFPAQAEDTLPDLLLSGPVSAPAAAYLGVRAGPGPMRLSDVKAEFLLIEVFSMYCPHCQREAPRTNEFYRLLKASPQAARIKLLGVGVGNSEYEVGFFRDKYKVPFPLFPDPDFTAHEAFHNPGTPFFLLARRAANGPGFDILFTHLGEFTTPAEFLKAVADKAGPR
jgi:peroxiredoxin